MSEKWNQKEIFPIPEDWDKFKENDFNDWLANNIHALEEILNINNIEKETERESKNEDNKRLDILASYFIDEEQREYIAIETQLNTADFSHFGRLIMYMASNSKKPKTGVWIVKDAQDSHTKSVEWLNENTLTEFDFWLLSVNTVVVANKSVGVEIVTLVKPDKVKRELYQEKKIEEFKKTTDLRISYQQFWDIFAECENNKETNFGKAGRNNSKKPVNWALISCNKYNNLEISIANNKIIFKIFTDKTENNTKWRDQNWIEKLGENWTYRVGGQKKDVFFLEKEMFSNWQDNESKWEDYANQLIDEALKVRDFLEKNTLF